jgi:general secretion pathway protein B
MSYILDALRRADAERERGRGSVPGIHAQQLPPGAPRDTRTRRPGTLLWVRIGLAVLLLASLAWQWMAHDDGTAAPTDPARAAQGTVTPAAPPPIAPPDPPPPAPTPATAMEPQAPAAAMAAAPGQPAPEASAPPPPTTRPVPPPRTAPAAVPRTPPATELATARPGSARAKPPQAAASAAAALPRVMSRSELPDDVQRGLPALTIGGASYSQNPESRMLIVNGQIFREGDQLAPNVSLEQIRLKEAVIATKGYRFRIDY